MNESWRNAKTCRILLTGAAGFIGFHLSRRLLADGHEVLGVDDLNPYYDPKLKADRLEILKKSPNFQFHEISIASEKYTELHQAFKPQIVVHLAAQAGVRYSLQNPWAYVEANLVGFQRVIEAIRANPVEHFIFASSSSVYGRGAEVPYSTKQKTDDPVSLYAATKKSNEVTASSYATLFGIPTTGLRFFTVYGSWGRPDMAYFSFTKKLLSKQPLQLFNDGKLRRDFTHIDDIVESICRLLPLSPTGEKPFRLLNIGASQPVELADFVATLEKVTGVKSEKEYLPMQAGDVYQTFADVTDLEALTNYRPQVSLEKGLTEFYQWFQDQKALERYR